MKMKSETKTKNQKYTEADHYRKMTGIENLPDNVAEYLNSHYSNIQFDICKTDVENGYGEKITRRVSIMLPYKRCINCGYHSLWNPDDSESHCRRHTYEKGWATVFSFQMNNAQRSLENAFDEFLKQQPENENDPVVFYYE